MGNIIFGYNSYNLTDKDKNEILKDYLKIFPKLKDGESLRTIKDHNNFSVESRKAQLKDNQGKLHEIRNDKGTIKNAFVCESFTDINPSRLKKFLSAYTKTNKTDWLSLKDSTGAYIMYGQTEIKKVLQEILKEKISDDFKGEELEKKIEDAVIEDWFKRGGGWLIAVPACKVKKVVENLFNSEGFRDNGAEIQVSPKISYKNMDFCVINFKNTNISYKEEIKNFYDHILKTNPSLKDNIIGYYPDIYLYLKEEFLDNIRKSVKKTDQNKHVYDEILSAKFNILLNKVKISLNPKSYESMNFNNKVEKIELKEEISLGDEAYLNNKSKKKRKFFCC